MTTEKNAGAELKTLFSNISSHAEQHLSEVGADLRQTGYLLTEAIDTLSANFLGLCQLVEKQNQMVVALSLHGPCDNTTWEPFKRNAQQMQQHIDAAITGLQFQDMTDQLIARTMKRVDGLKLVFGSLDTAQEALSDMSNEAEMTRIVEDVDKALTTKSRTLQEVLWKSVCQTHMQSGDIELF